MDLPRFSGQFTCWGDCPVNRARSVGSEPTDDTRCAPPALKRAGGARSANLDSADGNLRESVTPPPGPRPARTPPG